MIGIPLYSAFLAAVAVLLAIPGPNVALIVANSVAHGTRVGLLTVAGTSLAMLLQLALAAVGMTAALGALGQWFEVIRWLGVGYLLWLGIRAWTAPVVALDRIGPDRGAANRGEAGHPAIRRIVGRGLLVSLCNPKTLLFYGAFFPQFIATGSGSPGLGLQIAILSGSFMAMAILFDSAWAVTAGRARRLLSQRGRLRNRVTGGMLMGAGLGLALIRRG